MKKIFAILSLLSIVFSLAACHKNDTVDPTPDENMSETPITFDIVEKTDIVLGDEVDSVVITTASGEKITVDGTYDFYEIFDKIGYAFEDGKKYSTNTVMKLQDECKYFVNMNYYALDNATLVEFRGQKEGDDAIYAGEEFSYQATETTEEGTQSVRIEYVKHLYKDEKAFGGLETKDTTLSYTSNDYPTIPPSGTEFGEMHAHSGYSKTMLIYPAFFENYEPVEIGGTTYDFNEFITREYKLYKNYIVFKQTAPFLTFDINTPENRLQVLHAAFSNTDCSITQEAYYNIETGEVELIKVYGNTMWHVPHYVNKLLEIDMEIYIHDIDETEYNQKLDSLEDYVKSNADK